MSSTEVANTIWSQLTRDTKMACGARDPMAGQNDLTFRVGADRPRQHITVTLTPADTYDVKLQQVSKAPLFKVTLVAEVEDIYVDALNGVIYDMVNKGSYRVRAGGKRRHAGKGVTVTSHKRAAKPKPAKRSKVTKHARRWPDVLPDGKPAKAKRRKAAKPTKGKSKLGKLVADINRLTR